MALSQDLVQFANAASGIYRLEFDKSQTAGIPAERIRLVVGFSKKGPFQTPIYCPDPGFFEDVFGKIDRKLERKGSFFHRMAYQALERGPILALNLLRLDDEDKTEYKVFSTSSTEANLETGNAKFAGFYNKDRFWYPDTDEFLENIGTKSELLQFTNLSQYPITIIARHSVDIPEFDIKAKDWYGRAGIPEFMHEDDYISDYFIDVIILKGDWSNYEKLSIDPIFGEFFDRTSGLKKESLTRFLGNQSVTVLGVYSGALMPDFIDMHGNDLSIESQINFESSVTGVFCAVDKEYFDRDKVISGEKIDLIGHKIKEGLENNSFEKLEFLSYDRTLIDDFGYESYDVPVKMTSNLVDLEYVGVLTDDTIDYNPSAEKYTGNLEVHIPINSQAYTDLTSNGFEPTDLSISKKATSYIVVNNGNDKLAPIIQTKLTSSYLIIKVSVEGSGYKVGSVGGDFILVEKLDYAKFSSNTFEYSRHTSAYRDYKKGMITTGDVAKNNIDEFKLNIELDSHDGTAKFDLENGITDIEILGDVNFDLPYIIISDDASSLSDVGTYKYSDDTVDANKFIIQSVLEDMNVVMFFEQAHTNDENLKDNEVYIDRETYTDFIKIGDYLVSPELDEDGEIIEGEFRLTRIIRILNETIGGDKLLRIQTDAPIYKGENGDTIERYKKVEDIIKYYKTFSLNGFKMDESYHVPNGTQERVDEIYDATLNPSLPLFKALIDKENIVYRYIVDGFGLGIQPESKNQLAYLAMQRQNATAILNFPSIKDFKKSKDPRFTDVRGSLSTRLISEGGDLAQNPSFVFSLPSIKNGATYALFFGPYITVRDLGKTVAVPPAGLVSNNYIEKYATAKAWSIISGGRRGVISGKGVQGLEINFTDEDRKYLENFGLNPIIFQRGYGLTIQGNKTAQQTPESALSSAHVREVLIYIEDAIAEMLKNYHWEFNTAQSRLEIKTMADQICKAVQMDEGIYDFDNIMDTSNNTGDVIDRNMGVLDTYVEPVKGLEVIVHRTTVLKTGQIATGQFR